MLLTCAPCWPSCLEPPLLLVVLVAVVLVAVVLVAVVLVAVVLVWPLGKGQVVLLMYLWKVQMQILH
jgi:hypothetical protein